MRTGVRLISGHSKESALDGKVIQWIRDSVGTSMLNPVPLAGDDEGACWSESMFLHVMNAKPLDGYRVKMCFDDGREGIADLTEALEGKMFEPLKDPEVFRQFRIDEELQTIVWINGADLAPEYLYYQTFRDDPELQVTFRKWGYIA